MAALQELNVIWEAINETSPAMNINHHNNHNILVSLPLTPISPDEEVIRLRGRRRPAQPISKTIDEIQLTPKKSPMKSPRKLKSPQKLTPPKTPLMPSRTSPRKRLNLQDFGSYAETTPLSPKKKGSPNSKRMRVYTPRKLTNIEGTLSTLSHRQLVDLVKSVMNQSPDIRKMIEEEIPVPDLNPLEEKLNTLQRNIYRSIPSTRWESNRDLFCYRRVSSHLESFKKECIEQGRKMILNKQWDTAIEYVLMAWRYAHCLPDWDTAIHNKGKAQCFKALGAVFFNAIKQIQLDKQELLEIVDRLKDLSEENNCLQPSIKYIEEQLSKQ